MEKNREINNVYEQIKDLNQITFTNLFTEAEASFSSLTTSINSIIENLELEDTWDDAISFEVNGDTKTGLDALINNCRIPTDVISKTGEVIEQVKKAVEEYNIEVDNYNIKENEWNQYKTDLSNVTDIDTATKKSIQRSIDTSYIDLRAIKKKIDILEPYAQRVINQLKDLLCEVNSDRSKAALNLSLVQPRVDFKPVNLDKFMESEVQNYANRNDAISNYIYQGYSEEEATDFVDMSISSQHIILDETENQIILDEREAN